MKSKLLQLVILLLIPFIMGSCSKFISQVGFPAADEMFITSGDGDIQKPYTPVGHLIYIRNGFRIPLPLLGFIPFKDVDPDYELKTEVQQRIKQMGGDGLINMQITYKPAKVRWYLLGALSSGGSVTIIGTVIKR
jgi:hypothetical protein